LKKQKQKKNWIPAFAGMTKKREVKKEKQKISVYPCSSVFIRGSLFCCFCCFCFY